MKTVISKILLISAAVIAISSCKKSANIAEEAKTANLGHVDFTRSLPGSPVTYYVKASGDDINNSGLDTGHPFKTITHASLVTLPGDIVYLIGGTDFTRQGTAGAVAAITKSGTSGAHIKYMAYQTSHPVIRAQGAIFQAVIINASYIDFDGVEVIGDNANLSLSAAAAAELAYRGNSSINISQYAQFNTNGIVIGDKTSMQIHVTVSNCKIHDMPAAGISMEHADWVTIEKNQVYNSCLFNMYGTSGITTKDNYDSDNTDTTSYRVLIRNNISHDNKSQVSYIYGPEGQTSDGNGIIVDVNNKAYGQTGYGNPYKGRTRLENNICYNNGGAGITTAEAHNVYMVNNTTYNNGLVNNHGHSVGDPELGSYHGYKLFYYNNIAYASARTGATCNGVASPINADGTPASSPSIVFDYNVYFRGASLAAYNTGRHYRTTDPLFVSTSTPDFHLSSVSSSAANSGFGGSPYYSYNDYDGVSRPKPGSYVDCGAFESF